MKKEIKMIAITCFLPGLISLANMVQAQEVLTLTQCVDKALQQSLQLTADGYDLEKTKAGIKQQYSALLPNISGSAAYQYAFQEQTAFKPAAANGEPGGTFNTVELGIPQTKNVQVNLNQSIFNPAVTIALKAAKVAVNLNKLQIQSSKEDLS